MRIKHVMMFDNVNIMSSFKHVIRFKQVSTTWGLLLRREENVLKVTMRRTLPPPPGLW